MSINKRWVSPVIASSQVVVWGAGDQGRVISPILESIGIGVLLLIDDTPNMTSPFREIPIARGESGLDKFLYEVKCKNLGFVVAIGNPFGNVRVKLHSLMTSKGLVPVSFSDPSALICKSATYGDGLQVLPGAIVHNDVSIGRQCIINTRALVEHDCFLGDGVEVGPGAVLCGRVTVGENSWIGANATVRPRITIGKNTIVGAGAVVVADMPDNVVAVGVPARVIRQNEYSE